MPGLFFSFYFSPIREIFSVYYETNIHILKEELL